MVPAEMPFAPAMEVGWRLAFEAWGRGFATEGALGALGFGFERFECDEIVALTAAINLRSQRVMEKLGMMRDSADDFEHPKLPAAHRLRRHVLYRLRRDAFFARRLGAADYTVL
ncbi:MAG: GNAT family N-acetyltransferase [Candidatus Eremiobacteraeota bacterium]|nr:GNAT family N-acetyltransferase [Candidatus Eremiobacteraeota bacterium]